jgi:hypothetical protein
MNTEFLWDNLKEKEHMKDVQDNFKFIREKCGVRMRPKFEDYCFMRRDAVKSSRSLAT